MALKIPGISPLLFIPTSIPWPDISLLIEFIRDFFLLLPNPLFLFVCHIVQIAFNLTRQDLGTLRLTAELIPSGEYNISVSSNEVIRDGFGFPLEASTANWTGIELRHKFEPVSPNNRYRGLL